MRIKLLFRLIIPLCLLPIGSPLSAQTPKKAFDPKTVEYLWPTNADVYLSASFGETRFSHFHAGIDVKTWGREGYEMYATRDGLLHRIGVSPYGYGNVLYLKHNDGSYSVYAHMRNFIPKLEALGDSLRLADFSYRVNTNVEHLNIRFKQGDLIGYSGSSGSGPAHIHFELRTPTESPFNPLLTNISIRDTKAPRFSRLSVEPLSRVTKIRNKHQRQLIRPNFTRGIYDFGTVEVSGPFGLAADIADGADDVLNVYAAYKIQLWLQDSLLYEARADSFSYAQTRMVKVDRVYELLNASRKGYQKFYTSDGNSLPFYTAGKDLKALDLAVGVYRFKMLAYDYNGNKAEAHLRVRVKEAAKEENPAFFRVYSPSKISLSDAFGPNLFKKWYWSREIIQVSLAKDDYLTMVGYKDDDAILHCGLMDQDIIPYKQYDSLKVYGPDAQFQTIYVLKPGNKEHLLKSEPAGFSLSIPGAAVLDTMPQMLFHPKEGKVEMFPDIYPFIEDFKLTTTDEIGGSIHPQSIFVQKYRGRDAYAGGAYQASTNSLVLSNYMPGSFELSEDTEAPQLSQMNRYRRKRDRKRLPGFRVSDNLSGIDLNRTEVWMNDRRGIPIYEPDQAVLMYYHPTYTPKKGDTFKVRLYDQAGNLTEVSLPLSF